MGPAWNIGKTFAKFRCYVVELYQTFELAPNVQVPTGNQPERIVARLRIDHQLVSERYGPWARASNVFTKYSVTIVCSACTAEHRNIEEWEERPFDKVPSVNVGENRRAANPIELYSRFISEELR